MHYSGCLACFVLTVFELDAVASHSLHMRYPLHSHAHTHTHTHAPLLRFQLEHEAILTALHVLYVL